VSPSLSPSASVSPSSSVSPSLSPSSSISPSQSPSLSPSESPSLSPSASESPSVSPSPSSGYKAYTKGDYAVLPTDDADLENDYVVDEILDVATSNDIRVAQTAEGEFAIHQYKDFVGSSTKCTLRWEGQSDLSPTISTVYLQIYNYNSSEWETVSNDNTSPADTDFELVYGVADLTDYKSSSLVICSRIYQEGI